MSMLWRNHRGLADRALELELGAVVRENRIEVIEPALSQGLDWLQDFDGAGSAWQLWHHRLIHLPRRS